MATSLAADAPSLASQSGIPADQDPFLSPSTQPRSSLVDTQLLATTSPEQAKRALEAHLAETEKRIQEASKLGTTLVQQRKELTERLKDVKDQQNEGDITPELRQKLVEIEKEYNEVGWESGRTFQPKSRVPSNELAGSPFGDTMRSISPSKFESQGTSSPSKLSVPSNRRQRNQPSNRVHNIEFATEISTSLLSQVRHLQALLAEKEEALKTITLEKSRLEVEKEGFTERLRSLDESEQRYKDENWNLETQIHEHIATSKEAADRERRLTHALNITQAEKSSAQKELDEIKSSHAKLSEDHAAAVKHHEVELGSVKRSMTMAETERGALQRKIEDLTGQNQELARAVAHQRGRLEDQNQSKGLSDEDFETAQDDLTPEHSPPPSPVKGTPRHSMLESETLKSSLHHAHRMIQNLKGNIHREKTEKLELKRMLQDARDELESRRGEFGSGNKRARKAESREFKKPLKPGQLGVMRSSRSEILLDDPNWEEDQGEKSPSHSASRLAAVAAASGIARSTESSDQFETANEQETSDAFETANERGTETDDFQTGHEEMSSDELTETEGGPSSVRSRPTPMSLSMVGNRQSFQSTASTSDDEYNYEELKTPTSQSQPQRLRLKVGRGQNIRKSRAISEEPQFQSSPASFANSSRGGTPHAAGQSLFAELGDLDGSEDESMLGTPNRSNFASGAATPASRPSTAKNTPAPALSLPPVPKIPMIDSGMMTEPWEPEPLTPVASTSHMAESGIAGAVAGASAAYMIHNKHDSTATQVHSPPDNYLKVTSDESSRPLSTSTYSDMSSQYDPDVMDEKLAKFPSPPTSRAHTPMTNLAAAIEPPRAPLTMSSIVSENLEPIEPVSPLSKPLPATPQAVPMPAPLAFSSIQSVATEPVEPRTPKRDAVIIPRDGFDADADVQNDPETPKGTFLGSVFGWNKGKQPATPIIAEDETRQSPSDSPMMETPESQKPFKEVSSNSQERSPKKPRIETSDGGAQTALTGDQIDEILRAKKKQAVIAEESQKVSSPTRAALASGVAGAAAGFVGAGYFKSQRSQESVGSANRAVPVLPSPDLPRDAAIASKRPGSSGSRNNSMSSIHPPLPMDHKQVIAAAAQRSGSSSGGPGSMGPPLMPASAYRSNPSFRPRTPSGQGPMSPASLRGGTTPRPLHSSGNAEAQTPSRNGARSRASSISSFTSEVETRFNKNGLVMPHGLESNTDPRMINAITQTMIGEYLWKYTRKAGRGAMSENRHRRYFWVHPYTKTLYWSDRDPSSAGRAELKAKSVPIEAVRVVTDDNPMPPGLHRKSLVIITPGRAVKFTATTGQRHETWFNALSYLLLRTGEDAIEDSSEVANGSLTHDDVAEFNPGYGSSSSRQGPASLSSYNSRTTRNGSPGKAAKGQFGTNSSRPSVGTFSRLSSYWKPGKDAVAGTFSSRRSRHIVSQDTSLYEASEVHDSAEDLREIIEKQDRESDRLENVRACCDGRHDVGHLHSSTKSRHSHAGPTPGSVSQRGGPRTASRTSVTRRTD